MNNKPLVTIGIPTYNRKELLKRALDSALKQTYKNIDILISDNHSNDGTEEMMKEYVEKDSRIRYFRQEENKGIGFQGKFLLENSIGEYYCGLCDDDYISENYIEECMNILLNNEDILVTYGTVKIIDEENKVIKTCPTFKSIEENSGDRIRDYAISGVESQFASTFMRTDLCKMITKDYDKNRFCEDQLFVVKGLALGKSICSDKTFYYKLNNGCSKDLEAIKNTFNMKDMTKQNYWYYLAKTYMDSILNDEVFIEKFTLDERLDMAIKAYETIKKQNKAHEKSFGQKIIDKIRGKE